LEGWKIIEMGMIQLFENCIQMPFEFFEIKEQAGLRIELIAFDLGFNQKIMSMEILTLTLVVTELM
jgi:hypothetical protein